VTVREIAMTYSIACLNKTKCANWWTITWGFRHYLLGVIL